jgi:hypothetical protein
MVGLAQPCSYNGRISSDRSPVTDVHFRDEAEQRPLHFGKGGVLQAFSAPHTGSCRYVARMAGRQGTVAAHYLGVARRRLRPMRRPIHSAAPPARLTTEWYPLMPAAFVGERRAGTADSAALQRAVRRLESPEAGGRHPRCKRRSALFVIAPSITGARAPDAPNGVNRNHHRGRRQRRASESRPALRR